MVGLALGLVLACSDRTIDPVVDYTEEVERICTAYCEMNVMCHEPAIFSTFEDCYDVCIDMTYLWDDTHCGEVMRDIHDCAGATTTCEAYNDTNNVHAEDYTCKAEKDRLNPGTCT